MQELGQTAKYDDKILFKATAKKHDDGDTFKTKTKVIMNNIQVKIKIITGLSLNNAFPALKI